MLDHKSLWDGGGVALGKSFLESFSCLGNPHKVIIIKMQLDHRTKTVCLFVKKRRGRFF